jgi:hypothetical protein
MIYQWIKAWKATKHYQNQVNECLFEGFFFIDCFVQIWNGMPHYLRMLRYASQPADDWGPARKQDQYGRYEFMNKNSTEPTESDRKLNNENINKAFNSQPDISSRL